MVSSEELGDMVSPVNFYRDTEFFGTVKLSGLDYIMSGSNCKYRQCQSCNGKYKVVVHHRLKLESKMRLC